MTINHEKKLIFIHIPKNAGTSIIKAMGVKNLYMDNTDDKIIDICEKIKSDLKLWQKQ
jgi:hypothetical protein